LSGFLGDRAVSGNQKKTTRTQGGSLQQALERA